MVYYNHFNYLECRFCSCLLKQLYVIIMNIFNQEQWCWNRFYDRIILPRETGWFATLGFI